MTAVCFSDRQEAQRCDDSFAELRQRLGLKKHKEFHFSKDSARIKSAFFEHVVSFDFKYSSFTVNKARLAGPGFRYKDPFYKYPIKLLFQNLKPDLNRATVVYDKCGERTFIRELGSYLQRALRNPDGSQTAIKKFRADPSHSNNLVQLADMVCGAVMLSMHTSRRGHAVYRRLLRQKGRERQVQFWPR